MDWQRPSQSDLRSVRKITPAVRTDLKIASGWWDATYNIVTIGKILKELGWNAKKPSLYCPFSLVAHKMGVKCPKYSYFQQPGQIQDFPGGGGGGGATNDCAHVHHEREARSPFIRPGSRAHVRAMEALRVFNTILCYLSLIFEHSDTKWDFYKQNIWGGGARLLRPPLNPPLFQWHDINVQSFYERPGNTTDEWWLNFFFFLGGGGIIYIEDIKYEVNP